MRREPTFACLTPLHGPARRTWRVLLNRCGLAALPSQAVSLTWPQHGLAGGRTLTIRGISVRGDRTDLLLWGSAMPTMLSWINLAEGASSIAATLAAVGLGVRNLLTEPVVEVWRAPTGEYRRA